MPKDQISAENGKERIDVLHSLNVAGLARRVLSRLLPRQFLRQVKRLFVLPADGIDLLVGRRRELVPLRYLNFVGGGDFEVIGNEFLKYFVEFGGLTPAQKTLDVGCGIGRMARPLTKYLTSGSYDGIDIVPKGIFWCQKHISKRYPNFRFQLADVRNLMYNPQGRFEASEYKFPFQNAEFDFTFLTSVFTHMRKPEMENYLGEIARTLRSNGKCLVTCFLLNNESRALQSAGRSSLNMKYSLDGCWTTDKEVPETAIAFDEEYIRSLYSRVELQIETVRYGAWCGRQEYLTYQDVIVARKK